MNTVFTRIHVAPKVVHLTRCEHCKAYSVGPCLCVPVLSESGFIILREGESFQHPVHHGNLAQLPSMGDNFERESA